MQLDGLPERLQARLARGRAAARARMLTRVAVMRRTGLSNQDEDTGRQAPEWATVYVDLPFRLDSSGTGQAAGGSTTKNISDVRVEASTLIGQMPYDTADLADGDLVEVMTGEWPGRVWAVRDASVGDQQTARRVQLEETKRPSEWEA